MVRRLRLAAALAVVVAAGACTTPPPGGEREGGVLPKPPVGAIVAGDDLYMVETGPDHDGCMQYSAWSATKAVPAVVYYREEGGGFTTDRSQAKCAGG